MKSVNMEKYLVFCPDSAIVFCSCNGYQSWKTSIVL